MVNRLGNLITRISAILLTAVMAVSAAGCDSILESMAVNKIESMVNDTFSEFFDGGCKADLNSSAADPYDVSEYIQEQMDLYRYGLSKAKFKLLETTVKQNRESGKCKIKFSKVPDYDSLDLWIATAGDYEEAISGCKTKSYTVTLKVTLNDNGDWVFQDLTPFFDLFLAPFADRCILDDDGKPVNITSRYVESFLVESVWYDPMMSNPLKDNVRVAPDTLTNVVYFNECMNMPLTAKLYKDNDQLCEKTVELADRNFASFSFYSEMDMGSKLFGPGSYRIKFYMDDRLLTESPDIVVR
ncbi:hypothetical protein SAMN02910456_00065 [Ruminococcaceae bacterium YRB3002]|nr:hypothetical protein SAMN02910456_00065 [Ruminococcaceae bacterium YRB3002]